MNEEKEKLREENTMLIIPVAIVVVLFLILTVPYLAYWRHVAKKDPKAAYLPPLHAMQWVLRLIVRISGIKLNVVGKENIPKDETVLYVSNHRGVYDILVTYPLVTGPTGYVAKNSLEKIPLLPAYMRQLHCHFMDREDIKQSLKVILAAIDDVKNGVSIFIFPEGTRNKDLSHPEEMLPFKEGSFKIATKTGCRIVPMAISGTDQVFEAQLPWIKPGVVNVTVGEPIDPKSLSKDELKHIGSYVQSIVQGMLNEQLGIENKEIAEEKPEEPVQ